MERKRREIVESAHLWIQTVTVPFLVEPGSGALSLSFLFCKVGMTVTPASRGC